MEIRFLRTTLRIPYSFLLLIAALVCFWQFAFFQNGLKWDIQNAMLPWRYFAGENFQNGLLPLWNPYQQFGSPFYADLQYTNWSPEVWLIGNFFGYSYKSLYVLIFFYVWMAGIGTFRLAQFFCRNREIAFFIALTYMLSGCTVSHMQQFNVMISMAWMPFVVWQFFEFLEQCEWKNVFGFALFSFLQITGYSALFFMLLYFFIAVLVLKVVTLIKNREFPYVRKIISRGCVLLICTVILLLPVFIAVHDAAPFVERLESGVSIEEANVAPFTPKSLLSFIFPVISVKEPAWIDTDITCANIFVGIISFPVFIISLFRRQSRLQFIIISFILIYLLASFGNYTPVRKLLFDYFPLMNLFRIPGLFRIVVVLLMLVQLSLFLRDYSLNRKTITLMFWINAMFYLSGAIITFGFFRNDKFRFSYGTISDFLLHSGTAEILFLQCIVFFVIALLGFLIARYSLLDWTKLSVISLASLFIATQCNIYINIAEDNKPEYVSRWMKQLPTGFPLATSDQLGLSKEFTVRSTYIGMNEGNFNKMLLLDEFSSFQFKGLQFVSDTFPEIRKQFSYYPLAYLSDSLVRNHRNFKANVLGKRVTFVDTAGFGGSKFNVSSDDRVVCTRFLPGDLVYKVSNRHPVIFNLLQSSYPNWKIMLDGKEIKHFMNAKLCMSFVLLPGSHEISFRFEHRLFSCVLLSVMGLFFIGIAVFVFLDSSKFQLILPSIVIITACISFVIFFSRDGVATSHYNYAQAVFRRMQQLTNNGLFLSRLVPEPGQTDSSLVYSDNISHFQRAIAKLKNCDATDFLIVWYGEKPDSRLIEFVQSRFPRKQIVYGSENDLYGAAIFSNMALHDDFTKVFEWDNDADSVFFADKDVQIERLEGEKTAIMKMIFPYSPVFEAGVEQLSRKGRLPVRAAFEFACDSLNNSIAYFAIYDSLYTPVWSRGYRLRPFITNQRKWNYFVVKECPDIQLKSGMRFRFFIVNSSDRFIYLRKMRLETTR